MIDASLYNFSAIIGILAVTISTAVAGPVEAPRMDKEKVKSLLGDSTAVIVDVRQPKDWDNSESRIKTSVRRDPNNVEEWVDRLPKNKTLIFHCA